ncbi:MULTISPECIES: hypothetical protein [Rhodococcus]|uniref:Restriction endonuclease type IV Mrr domain-containing protein n=1 Tax=Rhodococcus cerastii TaxID=908616 RepID=A0ABU4D651_9NOCA|nr:MULTISPECIES: hypothetical protein [Rhodococcus]MDV6305211.1 hypothetical protein [Rhodococcus cerastii]MDV8058112.1 hypothetical protein [Rhodococcus sp. IEGM 1343]
MNVPLTRRDVREPVRRSAQKLGFADASTRKGTADQTFHIDGKRVIGRGTVSSRPVEVDTLHAIHRDVYLLDRMKNKVRLHTAHGGYSTEARRFARENNIRLYTLTSKGELRRLGRAPVIAGRTLDRIGVYAVGVLLGLIALGWALTHLETVGTVFLVVIAVAVAIPVLWILGWIFDLTGPRIRK